VYDSLEKMILLFFSVIHYTEQILEAYTENAFIVFSDKTTRMFRIQ